MAVTILISCSGRSLASVDTLPMRSTVPMPAATRPKMVCLPSRWGVGASVMKNCEPAMHSEGRCNVADTQARDHPAGDGGQR